MTHPSAKGVAEIYEAIAETWHSVRGQDLFELPWLGAFLDLAPPAPQVLDLGCATGQPLAAYLIGQGARITGIDVSPAMIAQARRNFPDHDWRVADIRDLPALPRFDAILAFHSFFHLPGQDQRRLIPLFGQLARPGAPLLFTSGPAEGEAIGSLAGRLFYHASLAPDDYRNLLQEAGFAVVRHVVEDPSCGGATLWLAQKAKGAPSP